MKLSLLKTYVRVVETRNLSKTAEEFGISQPAVTKQIQALEDMYGILLLERSGRRLRTTEAGEILYNYAQEVIKAVEKTEKAMEEAAENNRGNLCIGASTIPGQYILPGLIKCFKDDFPNINISLEIADTEKIFNRVVERTIDVGIVGSWINSRKVEGYKWLDDKLILIVPKNHHLAGAKYVQVSDLTGEKWVFREKGSGTRKAVEEFLSVRGIKKEELNICMEAGSTEALLATVESGMGISIVSAQITRGSNSQGLASVPINDSEAIRHFYVIYPRQKTRRNSVVNFLAFLKK